MSLGTITLMKSRGISRDPIWEYVSLVYPSANRNDRQIENASKAVCKSCHQIIFSKQPMKVKKIRNHFGVDDQMNKVREGCCEKNPFYDAEWIERPPQRRNKKEVGIFKPPFNSIYCMSLDSIHAVCTFYIEREDQKKIFALYYSYHDESDDDNDLILSKGEEVDTVFAGIDIDKVPQDVTYYRVLEKIVQDGEIYYDHWRKAPPITNETDSRQIVAMFHEDKRHLPQMKLLGDSTIAKEHFQRCKLYSSFLQMVNCPVSRRQIERDLQQHHITTMEGEQAYLHFVLLRYVADAIHMHQIFRLDQEEDDNDDAVVARETEEEEDEEKEDDDTDNYKEYEEHDKHEREQEEEQGDEGKDLFLSALAMMESEMKSQLVSKTTFSSSSIKHATISPHYHHQHHHRHEKQREDKDAEFNPHAFQSKYVTTTITNHPPTYRNIKKNDVEYDAKFPYASTQSTLGKRSFSSSSSCKNRQQQQQQQQQQQTVLTGPSKFSYKANRKQPLAQDNEDTEDEDEDEDDDEYLHEKKRVHFNPNDNNGNDDSTSLFAIDINDFIINHERSLPSVPVSVPLSLPSSSSPLSKIHYITEMMQSILSKSLSPTITATSITYQRNLPTTTSITSSSSSSSSTSFAELLNDIYWYCEEIYTFLHTPDHYNYHHNPHYDEQDEEGILQWQVNHGITGPHAIPFIQSADWLYLLQSLTTQAMKQFHEWINAFYQLLSSIQYI